MAEVVVTDGDAGEGQLGAAAVAAAATAGAADANADAAKTQAQEAQRTADQAARDAQEANSRTFDKVTYGEAREMARQAALDVISELDELAKATPAPPAPQVTVTEEVHEEVRPPSVAKANEDGKEKKRWAHKWLGIES